LSVNFRAETANMNGITLFCSSDTKQELSNSSSNESIDYQ